MTLALEQNELPGSRSYGVSKEADYVAERESENFAQLRQTYTMGFEGVLDELEEVADECADPNWDGYGATPVEYSTLLNAKAFVKEFPYGTPAPSAGAEPDGHLTLEWYRSPDCVLSVSISPEGNLYYAAMLGDATTKGEDVLSDETPAKLLEIIARLYGG